MAKFKVGDKVRVVRDWKLTNGSTFIDKIATITMDDGTRCYPYRIDIDGGNNPWEDGELELIKQPIREFIVIRRDGAKTIAELRHDREVIKSGTATCAPSDTFDFNTGAQLAFDRLMGREMITFSYEIAPDKEPQPAHKFKVGDRVNVSHWGIGTVVGMFLNPLFKYIVEVETPKPQKMYFNEDRIFPAPEPPKFYTGKVVCVEWKGDVFRHKSAGRIAIITNGISDYDGWNRLSKRFESFSDFCSANTFGVFYEIKE